MGLVARLLGRTTKKPREQRVSRLQATSREQTRRELIAMALRDTLKKYGLPAGSITGEALPVIGAGRDGAMHVQLVFRHAQPRLLSYAIALEVAIRGRLARLDPLSPSWISGLSWRFDPVDRAQWLHLPAGGPLNLVSTPRSPAATPCDPAVGSPKASLEGMLSSGDAAFRRRGRGHLEFSPTLPMPGR